MTAIRRASMLGAVLVLALVARIARADVEAEAAARHALIMLRVLAYDKVLVTRAPGDELIIVMVSGTGDEPHRDRDRWIAGFALLPRVKAGGRPIRVYTVDYDDQPGFDAAVARLHPAAVIVGIGLSDHVADICRVTRARQASSFSTREADVRDGFAIGIVMAEERDEIVINLDAARAEGARFGAGLLQLARLVDERRR